MIRKPCSSITLAGLFLLCVLSSFASPPRMGSVALAAEARAPGAAGQILFLSSRDGNQEIYLCNRDGSGLVNLTRNASSDTDPEWSPDGSRIAFVSARRGTRDVWVMNADGSGLVQLTRDAGDNLFPQWSPDGRKLCFVSTRKSGRALWLMNADGSGQTKLTDAAAAAKWSPDGARICFVVHPDEANGEIYTIAGDGSNRVRLTTNRKLDSWPEWTPDGRIVWIAERFEDIPGVFGVALFVMNADGKQSRCLSADPPKGRDTWFAVSPDGKRVAFYCDREAGAKYELHVMSITGSQETRLADMGKPTWEDGPAWSPDGTAIAFQVKLGDKWSIYTINADGTGLSKVTSSAGDDERPRWRPRSTSRPQPKVGK